MQNEQAMREREIANERALQQARANGDRAAERAALGTQAYNAALRTLGVTGSAVVGPLRDAAEAARRQAEQAFDNGRITENSLQPWAQVERQLRLNIAAARDNYNAVVENGMAEEDAALRARARAEAIKSAREGTPRYLELLQQATALLREEERLKADTNIVNRTRALDRETDALKRQLDTMLQYSGREREIQLIMARLRQTPEGRNASPATLRANALSELGNRQEEFNIETQRGNDQRQRGYETELQLMGLTGDALDRRRMLVEMENAAKERGVDLDTRVRDRALEDLEAFQRQRRDYQRNPINGLTEGFDQILNQGDRVADSVRDTFVRSFDNMAESLVEFTMTGKASFKDFANSLIRDISRIILRQIVLNALMRAVGFAMGGGGGLSQGDIGMLGSNAGATINHTGGIAGRDGATRSVPMGMFANARRFHTGGMVGLSSGEVPIIARRGEAVMPTVRLPDGNFGVRALGGAGGGGSMVFAPNVTVNVTNGGSGGGNNPSNESGDMGQRIARELNTALEAKFSEFVRQQQRPGGLFNNRVGP
jgi:lambda family phage tail tape measure protein